MFADNTNYSAWKNLQILISANRIEKHNFSKTPQERADLMTAKMNWRARMRQEHTGWTKAKHHQLMRQSGKV